jgi:hypothetical protein
MNTAPDSARHDEQPEAEGETAAMGVQLGKEAASWAKQRGQQPDRINAASKQPALQRHTRPSSGASKKSNVSPVTGKQPGSPSRPFSMSYDGQTQAEYIQHLFDRGSR